MGKGIHKTAVVPVEATLLGLAVALVSLRLFLRLWLQKSRLTVSDWLVIASILDGVALITTDIMAYKMGGMDDYDPAAPPPPPSEERALLKVQFAGNYFYDSGIYLPKLALLAFYYRLVPPTMPKLRKCLYVATGLTCCFALTTICVDTFWCGSNVSVNWQLGEGYCRSFESMEITQIDWALNLASDLMIFSIPFPLLRGLHVNKRYMIGLVATFSSGMITVAMSISRFVTLQVIHAWTNVYVLSMAELVAAIVVVCLPSLKSLVHHGVELTTAKRSGNESGSHGRDFKSYGTSSSHMKLSSKDPFRTTTRVAASGDDSGSDVELTTMTRSDVIYKSERVSVTSHRRDEEHS